MDKKEYIRREPYGLLWSIPRKNLLSPTWKVTTKLRNSHKKWTKNRGGVTT
jgi:hypothetical protein